jgi:hypothetical protein
MSIDPRDLKGQLDVGRQVCAGQGLTQGQLDVLRRIVVDPTFRTEFSSNPVRAVSTSGFKLTAAEVARLEKLSPVHLEQFSHGVSELMKASQGCTHTLLYAIIVALLLAAADRQIERVVAF